MERVSECTTISEYGAYSVETRNGMEAETATVAGENPLKAEHHDLYEQFSPLVGSLMRRYGSTPELRKDLQGEIYCQFRQLVDSYDLDRGIPIAAYLARMLSQRIFNYVRDYWRGENRYVHLEPELLEGVTFTGTVEVNGFEDELQAQEVLNALPAAIAALPHRQRLVLVWRYYEERSFEQIANELGIQPATARSLLRHAITSLRSRLTKQELAGF
ncbi:MAG: sigma-70 family RNA polymerase sigma factor [Actinomycetota bacterium]